MSEAKHTPGPWFLAPDPGQQCDECGSESAMKHMVGWKLTSGCVVGLATVLTDDREDANAHLIAAAPDLLAACNSAIPAVVAQAMDSGDYSVAKLLRSAIAKATGGEG